MKLYVKLLLLYVFIAQVFPILVCKFIDDVITIIYNCVRGGENVTNKRKYPNGQ